MNKTAIIILVILLVVIAIAVYFLTQNNNVPSTSTASLLNANQNQQMQQQDSSNFDIQGMKVEIVKEGSGEAAKTGDTVSVHYTGTLTNGTKFDSSVDRGTPFEFTLGQNRVIQGWELGVAGMKVGEKRKLTIPPELAYGTQSVGGVIPANSILQFDVELLGIN